MDSHDLYFIASSFFCCKLRIVYKLVETLICVSLNVSLFLLLFYLASSKIDSYQWFINLHSQYLG